MSLPMPTMEEAQDMAIDYLVSRGAFRPRAALITLCFSQIGLIRFMIYIQNHPDAELAELYKTASKIQSVEENSIVDETR